MHMFADTDSHNGRPPYEGLGLELPTAAPLTLGELTSLRTKFSKMLLDLAMLVTKRELELMQAQEAAVLAGTVRKIAGELSAAAATWARTSDAIREQWRV